MLVAAVAVREDLVHDAALVPVGTRGARLVDRELERGRLLLGIHDALAAHATPRGTQVGGLAVSRGGDEAVPGELRRLAGKLHGEDVGLALALERQDRLAHAVDPSSQRDPHARGIRLLNANAQGHVRSHGNGTERGPELGQSGIVYEPHSLPFHVHI